MSTATWVNSWTALAQVLVLFGPGSRVRSVHTTGVVHRDRGHRMAWYFAADLLGGCSNTARLDHAFLNDDSETIGLLEPARVSVPLDCLLVSELDRCVTKFLGIGHDSHTNVSASSRCK